MVGHAYPTKFNFLWNLSGIKLKPRLIFANTEFHLMKQLLCLPIGYRERSRTQTILLVKTASLRSVPP